MRCVNCGWENPERARFCSNCGQALQVIVQENALGTQEDNEIEKELKIYDHAIKINPQNAVAWYNKGIVLGKLGRYQESLKCFDHAIEINPQLTVAWVGKGVILGKLGHNQKALGCFDHAIEINPQLVEAWYNKGVIRM